MNELDPYGKSQHETGAKLDDGKNRLGLVLGGFANALVEVGKIGTFGAAKYTDDGWKSVPNGKARYTDAMLRHLLAEFNGERLDRDSQMLHAAHTAWNALARLSLLMEETVRAPAIQASGTNYPTQSCAPTHPESVRSGHRQDTGNTRSVQKKNWPETDAGTWDTLDP